MGGGISKAQFTTVENEKAALATELENLKRKEAAAQEDIQNEKRKRDEYLSEFEARSREWAKNEEDASVALDKELAALARLKKELAAESKEREGEHKARERLEAELGESKLEYDKTNAELRQLRINSEVREKDVMVVLEAEKLKRRKVMRELREESIKRTRLAFEASENAKSKLAAEHTRIKDLNAKCQAGERATSDMELSVRAVETQRVALRNELVRMQAVIAKNDVESKALLDREQECTQQLRQALAEEASRSTQLVTQQESVRETAKKAEVEAVQRLAYADAQLAAERECVAFLDEALTGESNRVKVLSAEHAATKEAQAQAEASARAAALAAKQASTAAQAAFVELKAQHDADVTELLETSHTEAKARAEELAAVEAAAAVERHLLLKRAEEMAAGTAVKMESDHSKTMKSLLAQHDAQLSATMVAASKDAETARHEAAANHAALEAQIAEALSVASAEQEVLRTILEDTKTANKKKTAVLETRGQELEVSLNDAMLSTGHLREKLTQAEAEVEIKAAEAAQAQKLEISLNDAMISTRQLQDKLAQAEAEVEIKAAEASRAQKLEISLNDAMISTGQLQKKLTQAEAEVEAKAAEVARARDLEVSLNDAMISTRQLQDKLAQAEAEVEIKAAEAAQAQKLEISLNAAMISTGQLQEKLTQAEAEVEAKAAEAARARDLEVSLNDAMISRRQLQDKLAQAEAEVEIKAAEAAQAQKLEISLNDAMISTRQLREKLTQAEAKLEITAAEVAQAQDLEVSLNSAMVSTGQLQEKLTQAEAKLEAKAAEAARARDLEVSLNDAMASTGYLREKLAQAQAELQTVEFKAEKVAAAKESGTSLNEATFSTGQLYQKSNAFEEKYKVVELGESFTLNSPHHHRSDLQLSMKQQQTQQLVCEQTSAPQRLPYAGDTTSVVVKLAEDQMAFARKSLSELGRMNSHIGGQQDDEWGGEDKIESSEVVRRMEIVADAVKNEVTEIEAKLTQGDSEVRRSDEKIELRQKMEAIKIRPEACPEEKEKEEKEKEKAHDYRLDEHKKAEPKCEEPSFLERPNATLTEEDKSSPRNHPLSAPLAGLLPTISLTREQTTPQRADAKEENSLVGCGESDCGSSFGNHDVGRVSAATCLTEGKGDGSERKRVDDELGLESDGRSGSTLRKISRPYSAPLSNHSHSIGRNEEQRINFSIEPETEERRGKGKLPAWTEPGQSKMIGSAAELDSTNSLQLFAQEECVSSLPPVRHFSVLVDKSSSMRLVDRRPFEEDHKKSRWDFVREALELLVPQIVECNAGNGITLYFYSSGYEKFNHVNSAAALVDTFNSVRPKGGTQLVDALNDALVHDNSKLPETVLVITDGPPERQREVEAILKSAVDTRNDDFRLVLVQVGEDSRVPRWLAALKKQMGVDGEQGPKGEGKDRKVRRKVLRTASTAELDSLGIKFSQWVISSVL